MVNPIIPRGTSRIATSGTFPAGTSVVPRVEQRDHSAPPRPRYNFVPTPEVLEELIERALAALRRGIYWDRGSIINILL